MDVPRILFGLLILMAAAFAAMCAVDETPDAQGFDHADFPSQTIYQAPPGIERHRGIIVAATCYGAITYVFAGAGLALALSPRARSPRTSLFFTIMTVASSATVCAVSYTYWQAVGGDEPYLAGFPRSTALLLYLLGPVAFVFVITYAVKFQSWIMTPEDEQKFREIVKRRRARET